MASRQNFLNYTEMKKCLILVAVALCVSACSNHVDEPEMPRGDVTFTGSIIPVTRATDTSFENGDEIGVFAQTSRDLFATGGTMLYADNVKYTFRTASQQFVPSSTGIVYSGQSLRYYAIYPYCNDASLDFTFAVKNDQSTSAGYMQSDLCTATTSGVDSENVNLIFGHRLSKVVINLTGSSIPSDLGVQLKNVQTQANVDLAENQFSAMGQTSNVTMGSNGNNSLRAVVPTQHLQSVIITTGGKTNEVVVNRSLVAGKQSEISIEVKNQGETYVVIGGQIDDWGNDDGGNNPPSDDDPLFEEPYIIWGANVSSVQTFMNNNGYTILNTITKGESNWWMAYNGKHKEFVIEYDFTTSTGGLMGVYVLFESNKVKLSDVVSFFDANAKYDFLTYDEENGIFIYAHASDNNTLIGAFEDDSYVVVQYLDYSTLSSNIKASVKEKRNIKYIYAKKFNIIK